MSEYICHCINLVKAAHHLQKKYDEKICESGISANQYFLLQTLYAIGSSSTTVLAEAASLDRTTAVRNLQPLIRQGLIKNMAKDRQRNNQLMVTESGITTLKKASNIWKQLQRDYANLMGENELATFRQLLAKTQTF